ncbi:DUF6527 family protein [Pseudomonas sp. Tul1A2]
MRRFFTTTLRRLGWLKSDFLIRLVPRHPGKTAIPVGELWLVIDEGVRKWACFTCPGGCNSSISLSLSPDRRPRWAVEQDFWGRPTIAPSVHQHNACKCHFWITKGAVIWCKS